MLLHQASERLTRSYCLRVEVAAAGSIRRQRTVIAAAAAAAPGEQRILLSDASQT